jgi:hypothetical protein
MTRTKLHDEEFHAVGIATGYGLDNRGVKGKAVPVLN